MDYVSDTPDTIGKVLNKNCPKGELFRLPSCTEEDVTEMFSPSQWLLLDRNLSNLNTDWLP